MNDDFINSEKNLEKYKTDVELPNEISWSYFYSYSFPFI